jgi:single-strand DNA-binding protein
MKGSDPMNLVLLAGTIATDLTFRTLAAGTRLASFDVAVVSDAGQRSQVPIAWLDPPDAASSLVAGQEVVVTGEVRRRFFRTEGATASRTEVIADIVVPARQRTKAAAAISAALARAS